METHQEYLRWRESPVLTPAQRQELAALTSPEEINDRFYRGLEFGTAGLRGVMGMGLNRMNEYIVRQATAALGMVLQKAGLGEKGVCICFDCRNNSAFFAGEAALTLRAQGIPVRMFSQCRPTPQLSYAVRYFDAAAGINITASHNPREYNGYKAYWRGGAQLPPDKAALVAAEMEGLDPLAPRPAETNLAPLIMLGEDFDRKYIDAVLSCAIDREALAKAGEDFSVVYTPFHGVGGYITPTVLREAGLKALHCLPEQMEPDGDFPTVKSPNPEEPAGFALSVELAKKVGAPVIVGTDPDADRVGLVVRDKEGNYVPITGNRTGALLLHYILTAGKRTGRLPERPALVKTIVTSALPEKIAEKQGAACFNTFTGLKYMAEKVSQLEKEGIYRYVLAFEESYGYMLGDHARDKDGVVAALLLCEMAAWYHRRGMTVLDGLEEIWREYGCYGEYTRNVMLPGQDGLARMGRVMAGLRENPPKALDGIPVKAWRDYQAGVRRQGGVETPTGISGSNVLYFELETGENLVVRPSGTEPKIKIYALMTGDSREQADRRAESCSLAAQELILSL